MIQFKRGDTFIFPLLRFWKDKTNNERQSLAGVTIACSVNKGPAKIADLTSSVIDSVNGEFSLSYVGSTKTWPIGVLSCDIEFTLNTGQIISTQTFTIECIKDETIGG